MSHLPSSNPTHMWAPRPDDALWLPTVSSFGEGSGTYSRHRTAEPTSRLFTALGTGLLREKISICPWEASPPPPTCGERSKWKRTWKLFRFWHFWLHREGGGVIIRKNWVEELAKLVQSLTQCFLCCLLSWQETVEHSNSSEAWPCFRWRVSQV